MPRRKTLTPIEWSDLQKTDGYVFTDLDRDEIAPDADREALIGITFDDSAQMRSRSAELVALVLYKPLVREVIEHPSMIALKSARSNALSQ